MWKWLEKKLLKYDEESDSCKENNDIEDFKEEDEENPEGEEREEEIEEEKKVQEEDGEENNIQTNKIEKEIENYTNKYDIEEEQKEENEGKEVEESKRVIENSDMTYSTYFLKEKNEFNHNLLKEYFIDELFNNTNNNTESKN